jgi:hypothetical protein
MPTVRLRLLAENVLFRITAVTTTAQKIKAASKTSQSLVILFANFSKQGENRDGTGGPNLAVHQYSARVEPVQTLKSQ